MNSTASAGKPPLQTKELLERYSTARTEGGKRAAAADFSEHHFGGKTCRQISSGIKDLIKDYGFNAIAPLIFEGCNGNGEIQQNLQHSLSWQFSYYVGEMAHSQRESYKSIVDSQIEIAMGKGNVEMAEKLRSHIEEHSLSQGNNGKQEKQGEAQKPQKAAIQADAQAPIPHPLPESTLSREEKDFELPSETVPEARKLGLAYLRIAQPYLQPENSNGNNGASISQLQGAKISSSEGQAPEGEFLLPASEDGTEQGEVAPTATPKEAQEHNAADDNAADEIEEFLEGVGDENSLYSSPYSMGEFEAEEIKPEDDASKGGELLPVPSHAQKQANGQNREGGDKKPEGGGEKKAKAQEAKEEEVKEGPEAQAKQGGGDSAQSFEDVLATLEIVRGSPENKAVTKAKENKKQKPGKKPKRTRKKQPIKPKSAKNKEKTRSTKKKAKIRQAKINKEKPSPKKEKGTAKGSRKKEKAKSVAKPKTAKLALKKHASHAASKSRPIHHSRSGPKAKPALKAKKQGKRSRKPSSKAKSRAAKRHIKALARAKKAISKRAIAKYLLLQKARKNKKEKRKKKK